MKTGIILSATGLSFLLTACASTPATTEGVPAATPASTPASSQASALPASSTGQAFSEQELQQLVAPIALHPDALFAQILMASTYPLEIVAADRWVKANPGLEGKALEDALQGQPWDPSVKSLTVFPQVLAMMSEKIDWTQKLGDAFLAQQKDVLAAAQALRNKAAQAGTLKDTEQQRVVTGQAESNTVIQIVPANPEVIHVPTYNPTVVYGAWPYPAYPPYYYYPPGYTAGAALFAFAAGAAVGAALWGDCDWGHGDVNINTNRYNSFNRTNVSNRRWSHNAAHRGAVPYRDRGMAQQYGRGRAGADAAAREQFRGRADAGRSAIERGDIGNRNQGIGDRNAGFGSSGRGSTGFGDRGSGLRDSGMRNASAFDTGRGGQARDFSSRGGSSMSAARSSGNFGGGLSRGGGMRGGRGGGRGGR